jgi:hypothetical protein
VQLVIKPVDFGLLDALLAGHKCTARLFKHLCDMVTNESVERSRTLSSSRCWACLSAASRTRCSASFLSSSAILQPFHQ